MKTKLQRSSIGIGCGVSILSMAAFLIVCLYQQIVPLRALSGKETVSITNGLYHGEYEYSGPFLNTKGLFFFGAKTGVWTNYYSANNQVASISFYSDAVHETNGTWRSTLTNAWNYDYDGKLAGYEIQGLGCEFTIHNGRTGMNRLCEWQTVGFMTNYVVMYYPELVAKHIRGETTPRCPISSFEISVGLHYPLRIPLQLSVWDSGYVHYYMDYRRKANTMVEVDNNGKILEFETKAPSLGEEFFEIPCVLNENIYMVPCKLSTTWKFDLLNANSHPMKKYSLHDFRVKLERYSSNIDHVAPTEFATFLNSQEAGNAK